MLQLIKTSDGSHTLLNEELQETYHSIHGAIQESNHVFIKHGLHHLSDNSHPDSIKILEVGFGTGLNALLTALDKNSSGIPKCYDAVEAFPLPCDLASQLNYPDILGIKEAKPLFMRLHFSTWNEPHLLTPNFTIRKIDCDIQKTLLGRAYYNIVYFDAFAPSKQPELWRFETLELIIRSLKHGGIFVTYSAKGQLKRDLKKLGMIVESLKGPPGKAQMTRARKSTYLD